MNVETTRGYPSMVSFRARSKLPWWHLMDLSLSGALLEVPSALPANARYSLKLPMSETESVELHTEVVRSYVHGFDSISAGKPAVKYRAAIKFVDLTDAQQKSLKQLMDRGSGDPIQVELSS